MPAQVTLALVIPPELGDSALVRHELRERVEAVERSVAAARARSGAPVLGRRAVLRQSWRGQPSAGEPRRGLRPRIAARSMWSRIEALLRNRAFVIAYREARARWTAPRPTPAIGQHRVAVPSPPPKQPRSGSSLRAAGT